MRYFFLLFISVALVACGGKKKSDDGGLELTDAQLKALMKQQPTAGGDPGQGEAALKQLEAAYQTDSSDIDNVYNLAFLHCGQCLNDSSFQACPKAEQYLSRVVVLKSDYREGKAFYNRYLCLQHRGALQPALEDLNSFIAINSKNPKPAVNFYLQKAALLQKMGKMSEACAELKKANKIDTIGLSSIEWKNQCK
jgi:tetratricopeptide (TPR) repeat protein